MRRYLRPKPTETASEGICPSCGRTIGTRMLCHHCGARSYGRTSEKFLVLVASILLVIAMLLFRLVAVYAETPITKIADLTEDHNFMHVRIVGRVIDAPGFYPDEYGTSGLLRFYVNDTTGEIAVKSESALTKKLMERNKIPGCGDVVDLEGTLYAGEEYRVIKIRSYDSLEIKPRRYEYIPISLIDRKEQHEFQLGKPVEISGTVDYKVILSFAYIVDVADDEGNEVTVYVPTSIVDLTGINELMNISVGSEVTVRGGLKWYDSKNDYYDRWEIIPASTADIVLSPITPVNIARGADYLPCAIDDLLLSPSSYNQAPVRLENVTVVDDGSYGLGYGADLTSWVTFRVSDISTNSSLQIYAEGSADRPLNLSVEDVITVQGIFIQYEGTWEVKIRADTDDYIEKSGRVEL